MATLIIAVIIGIFFIFGIKHMLMTSKEGCCSTGDHIEKIKPEDPDKKHYPYTTSFTVQDMHCANCATKISNALNKQKGTMASINLSKKEVTVFTKQEPQINTITSAIHQAGYSCQLK